MSLQLYEEDDDEEGRSIFGRIRSAVESRYNDNPNNGEEDDDEEGGGRLMMYDEDYVDNDYDPPSNEDDDDDEEDDDDDAALSYVEEVEVDGEDEGNATTMYPATDLAGVVRPVTTAATATRTAAAAESESEEDEDGVAASVSASARTSDASTAAVPDMMMMAGSNNPGNNISNGNGDTLIIQASTMNIDTRLLGLREVGREALSWQLSSAKTGNGVEQIRDYNVETTYWQSDGNAQPHWIQVCFERRMAVSHVCLYLDYSLDESYTPKRVQVQAGTTDQDLVNAIRPPMTVAEFQEPVGWCIIPLSAPPDPLDEFYYDNSSTTTNNNNVVRAHVIRISILSMHQNGRDTHVRQVQLYGPRMMTMDASSSSSSTASASASASAKLRSSIIPLSLNSSIPFQTEAATPFSSIR